MSASTKDAPTERQLRYLRGLAASTATTFVNPRTRREASQEIDRLRSLSTAPRMRAFEARDEDADGDGGQLAYATAVHHSEVVGFGSSTTWRAQSPRSRASARSRRPSPERAELARYTVPGGERVLCGQRLNGCVCVTDRPGSGTGRSYIVEHQPELDGEEALQALIADYLRQARELGEVPMASDAIGRMLAGVDPHV
jgi:hypothetical protein